MSLNDRIPGVTIATIIDRNDNGRWDRNEFSVLTESDGRFDLAILSRKFLVHRNRSVLFRDCPDNALTGRQNVRTP